MQVGKPFFINLACTGVIPTRAMSAHVPLSHDEILADVAQAIALGVQMVHLHARDEEGVQTADPQPYGRLIEAIRALPQGRQLIVGVTTSGRLDAGFEARSRVLALDGDARPDMASLTLSSLNFAQSASINAPDTIRRLAARMAECGIKPELEIFDAGMANFANVLLKEGLLQPPVYANVLLGNVAGAQADLLQLAAILAALPVDSIVGIAGLGRFQLAANGLGLLAADGVRVGLEDNLWFDQQRTIPASNRQLIERVLAQAALFERPLLDRAALRERLGIAR
ncbi:3-keto-5-aminohexanoate cleavage protein [Pseudomonas sp. NPDC090202]|uniref:3-keto-5-aminohexanoate cleavage protein n=1 Tax=unclassified Pseudomonas TaxID=196821 RepID=UPI003814E667